MIVTLTPNPALDLTLAVDRLDLGATVRIPPATARAGGKGLNVARVLHEQGVDVLAVVGLGGATGTRCRAELERAALPGLYVSVDSETRSTYALVTAGGTTNLNEGGSPATAQDWAIVAEATWAALRREPARVLVVSGSLPPGLATASIASLVAEATAIGVDVVADLQGEALVAAVRAGAAAVKPNREELLAAIGGDDPLTAARRLASTGSATVVVSLGEEGMLWVEPDGRARRARLDAPLRGNPTGAGDAAVAAIAADLAALDAPARDATIERALTWSAAAVLHPVAGSIGDPKALIGRVRIDDVD